MARLDKESRKYKQVIEEIETYMQQVKNEYEMYFMGITRKPPSEKQRELKRMFHELTQNPPTNTALTFRIRVVRTRFNSLSLRWLRTVKQIEDGTYKGQRFMADRRDAERRKREANRKTPAQVRAEIRALARGEVLEETVKEPAPEPTKAGAAAKAREGAANKRPKGAMRADSDALVSEYLRQRKANGEAAVNPKALQAKLRKTADQIKAKYGVRDVKFKVVTENGKSKVKAVPIK